MSTSAQYSSREISTRRMPLEECRGIYAMWCLILTEAALFGSLFVSYFYLGANQPKWPLDQPPKLATALVLLLILLASSAVLQWGQNAVKRAQHRLGRLMLSLTIAMGIAFLALQIHEYRDHWKTLTPFSDSYGSIFYAITTFHALHVIVGLLMLAYVLVLPRYGPARESPFRPYETAALYWHFVDVIWIFVVLILYVIPNFTNHG